MATLIKNIDGFAWSSRVPDKDIKSITPIGNNEVIVRYIANYRTNETESVTCNKVMMGDWR